MSVSEFHHVFTCEQWTRIGALEKASGLTTSSIFTFVLDSLCFFRYFFFIWFSVVFFSFTLFTISYQIGFFRLWVSNWNNAQAFAPSFIWSEYILCTFIRRRQCMPNHTDPLFYTYIHVYMYFIWYYLYIYIVTCKSWCSDGFFSLDSIKMILTNFYLLSFIRV